MYSVYGDGICIYNDLCLAGAVNALTPKLDLTDNTAGVLEITLPVGNAGYDKLERNLIDIIKEEQAKLGFFKEDIRLYYPLSSLNHFFNSSDSADEMQMRLDTLPESVTSKLGQIEVSHKGDRFCFHIPQEGTVYVHDNTSPNEFIHQLVELVGKHGCTMNEILDLFHTYSENIITEEMNNGEFDRLIRFADNSKDPYYYCFKDEGCHIIYHRFLPEDYADFDF